MHELNPVTLYLQLAEMESLELQLQLQLAEAALADERTGHAMAKHELASAHSALDAAHQAMSQRASEQDGANKEAAALAAALEDVQARHSASAAAAAAASAAAATALREAQAQAAQSQQQYEELKERAVELQRLLEESEAAVAAARQQGEDAAARADGLSEGLTAAGEALAAERASCAALREEGDGSREQVALLQGQLAQVSAWAERDMAVHSGGMIAITDGCNTFRRTLHVNSQAGRRVMYVDAGTTHLARVVDKHECLHATPHVPVTLTKTPYLLLCMVGK